MLKSIGLKLVRNWRKVLEFAAWTVGLGLLASFAYTGFENDVLNKRADHVMATFSTCALSEEGGISVEQSVECMTALYTFDGLEQSAANFQAIQDVMALTHCRRKMSPSSEYDEFRTCLTRQFQKLSELDQ
ncbi:hypothetical protein [Maritalea myrionectae]|uniref:hypothetical protein n=1 Tax=Maritalea myrionectae TaxID=454601 RepID=UPI0004850C83|nr:hypothetical protein [Maritalea myrionectae]